MQADILVRRYPCDDERPRIDVHAASNVTHAVHQAALQILATMRKEGAGRHMGHRLPPYCMANIAALRYRLRRPFLLCGTACC